MLPAAHPLLLCASLLDHFLTKSTSIAPFAPSRPLQRVAARHASVTMPARKRARQEVDQDEHPPPQEPTKLAKLRNTWEFASLTQYIYIFGSAVKIDEDIDVDVRAPRWLSLACVRKVLMPYDADRVQELEAECLTPTPSEKLAQIGLALLKWVSSHKGLT